jgi:hypothetical protein
MLPNRRWPATLLLIHSPHMFPQLRVRPCTPTRSASRPVSVRPAASLTGHVGGAGPTADESRLVVSLLRILHTYPRSTQPLCNKPDSIKTAYAQVSTKFYTLAPSGHRLCKKNRQLRDTRYVKCRVLREKYGWHEPCNQFSVRALVI